MALAYIDLYKLARDDVFSNRVQFAIHRAATVVRREDPGTANHATRDAWAKVQLLGPSQNMVPILNMVLTHNKVVNAGKDITDAELQNVVDGLVNDFAGL